MQIDRLLETTDECVKTSEILIDKQFIPRQSFDDALHIAIATLYEIDFLLTWNFRHIANPIMQQKIAKHFAAMGSLLPIICTPEQFLGVYNDE